LAKLLHSIASSCGCSTSVIRHSESCKHIESLAGKLWICTFSKWPLSCLVGFVVAVVSRPSRLATLEAAVFAVVAVFVVAE
jgi:hypothetical protein